MDCLCIPALSWNLSCKSCPGHSTYFPLPFDWREHVAYTPPPLISIDLRQQTKILQLYIYLTVHLNKLINEHFTNSFFLTKAPILLNEFLQPYPSYTRAIRVYPWKPCMIFKTFKNLTRVPWPCIIVLAIVLDRERPCETVRDRTMPWETVRDRIYNRTWSPHHEWAQPCQYRIQIVWNRTQTKVSGTVCKPCKCPVNRVKVVFNRTRLQQTVLDRTWNRTTIVWKSCSNRDKPFAWSSISVLCSYMYILVLHSSLNRTKSSQARLELNTRTSQPVYNRAYRIGTVCLTVLCVRQALQLYTCTCIYLSYNVVLSPLWGKSISN